MYCHFQFVFVVRLTTVTVLFFNIFHVRVSLYVSSNCFTASQEDMVTSSFDLNCENADVVLLRSKFCGRIVRIVMMSRHSIRVCLRFVVVVFFGGPFLNFNFIKLELFILNCFQSNRLELFLIDCTSSCRNIPFEMMSCC